jgi:hypothetical protein
MPVSVRAGRAVGVRQTGIGRTLVTQARFVIENDPPAAAAVKAGATRLPDALRSRASGCRRWASDVASMQVGPCAPGTKRQRGTPQKGPTALLSH